MDGVVPDLRGAADPYGVRDGADALFPSVGPVFAVAIDTCFSLPALAACGWKGEPRKIEGLDGGLRDCLRCGMGIRVASFAGMLVLMRECADCLRCGDGDV